MGPISVATAKQALIDCGRGVISFELEKSVEPSTTVRIWIVGKCIAWSIDECINR